MLYILVIDYFYWPALMLLQLLVRHLVLMMMHLVLALLVSFPLFGLVL